MKRNVIGAALFGAAMLVGGTTAVSAAPKGCEAGWVCMYRDDDYKGGSVNLTNTVKSIAALSGYGFNDEVNSWFSNYKYDSAWFYDANFEGKRKCMNSYSSNHSLSLRDYDEASSAKKYTSVTAC